jgi:toxin ParE1/3/4
VGNYTLSPEALEDLEAIWGYIAEDNPEAANHVVESARRTCANLAQHPELGPFRRFPKNDPPNIRYFVLTDYPNYSIFYRIVPGGIEIIRILHSARDLDTLFGG